MWMDAQAPGSLPFDLNFVGFFLAPTSHCHRFQKERLSPDCYLLTSHSGRSRCLPKPASPDMSSCFPHIPAVGRNSQRHPFPSSRAKGNSFNHLDWVPVPMFLPSDFQAQPLSSLLCSRFASFVSTVFFIMFQKFPAANLSYEDARLDSQINSIPLPASHHQLSVSTEAERGTPFMVPWGWERNALAPQSGSCISLCRVPHFQFVFASCLAFFSFTQSPHHIPSTSPPWSDSSFSNMLDCWHLYLCFNSSFVWSTIIIFA